MIRPRACLFKIHRLFFYTPKFPGLVAFSRLNSPHGQTVAATLVFDLAHKQAVFLLGLAHRHAYVENNFNKNSFLF
jgi:hypothetical protein